MIWLAVYLAGFSFTVGLSIAVYDDNQSDLGPEVWFMSAIWTCALMMLAGVLFARSLPILTVKSRTARHDKP